MDKTVEINLILPQKDISITGASASLIEFTEDELKIVCIIKNSEMSLCFSGEDNTEAKEQPKNNPQVNSPYVMSLKCKQNESKMKTNYHLDLLVCELVNRGNTCPFEEEDYLYEPNLIWEGNIDTEDKFPTEDLEISRVEETCEDVVNEDLLTLINLF